MVDFLLKYCIILLSFLVPTVLSAGCLDDLTRHLAEITGSPLVKDSRFVPTPSVNRIGQISGKHGGKRFVLAPLEGAQETPKKSSEEGSPGGISWSSMYKKFENAPQGDPRTFVVILGKEVGRYFGFDYVLEKDFQTYEKKNPWKTQSKESKLAEHEFKKDRTHLLVIPDVAEFSASIEQINIKLGPEDQIFLRYYVPVKGVNQVNLREYLERYGQDAALPLGENGYMYLHDVSFHTGSILLPNKVVFHVKKQTQVLLEHIRYIEERLAQLKKENDPRFEKYQNEMDQFVRKILKSRVTAIDGGTANFTYYLTGINSKSGGAQWTRSKIFETGFDLFSKKGSSPRELLDSAIHNYFILNKDGSFSLQNDPGFMDFLNKTNKDFFDEKSANDPDFSKKLTMSEKEFCDEVQRKRKAIEKAVRDLQAAEQH